jgi:uncharacterized protein (DUF1778 family)
VPKTSRLELRTTTEDDEQIREAARLMNQSVTSFVVTAATEKAARVIDDWRTTKLTDEYFDRLLASLDAPPTTNDAFIRAIQLSKG